MQPNKKREPVAFIFPKISNQSSTTNLPYSSYGSQSPQYPSNFSQGHMVNSSPLDNWNFRNGQEFLAFSPVNSFVGSDYQASPGFWNSPAKSSAFLQAPLKSSNYYTRNGSYGSLPFLSKHEEDSYNRFNNKLDKLISKQDEILKKVLSRNTSIESRIQPYVEEYMREKYKIQPVETRAAQLPKKNSRFNSLTIQSSSSGSSDSEESPIKTSSFSKNKGAVNRAPPMMNNKTHHKSISLHVPPIQSINSISSSPNRNIVKPENNEKSSKPWIRSNMKAKGLVIPKLNAAERKQYLRFKLRIWMFTLFFPILLFNTIKKKARIRKEEALKKFLLSKTNAEEESIKFFHDKLDTLLKKILESSNSLVVVSGKRKGYKTLSDEEIQQRMDKYVKPKTREFLQQIILATKGEDFKGSIWQFIGILIIENSFLPDKYLFECEIKRLNFSTLGALKNVNASQQNMLIGNFLLIRILIFKLVLCFDSRTNIKKTESTTKNALALASIIYYIFNNYFKSKIKVIEHNTVHLEKEAKLVKSEPIILAPEYEQLLKQNPDKWGDESILGLYTKDEIETAMEHNQTWVIDMQDQIEYWLNNIRQVVLDQIIKNEGSLVRRSSLG